jgi:hypothetical protein
MTDGNCGGGGSGYAGPAWGAGGSTAGANPGAGYVVVGAVLQPAHPERACAAIGRRVI